MGKKRVTYDLNDDNKPPNNVVIDRHHHHHHRHHNHQKPKKIKPEAKLLHTLNSHLKKLAKARSRNTISRSTPPVNVSPPKNKHRHGDFSSWLKHDRKDHHHDSIMVLDFDHDYVHHDNRGEIGVFELDQELSGKEVSFIGLDNNDGLLVGDCVYAPDLNASNSMWVVYEEDGLGYISHVADRVTNEGHDDEGKYLCDILELSSQEEMINEFIKVNLFVS